MSESKPSAPASRPAPALRPRLGRPRLLIVGGGDIGRRIVARLGGRFRVFATHRDAAGAAALRRLGAVPLALDLDQRTARPRLKGLAQRVVVTVPTSDAGRRDRRTARLLAQLGRPVAARMVYLSTSGVYGDRGGAWVDEATPPLPGNARSARRLDAERRLRRSTWRAAVLRVPGIYAADRLPLARLQAGLPVAAAPDDVLTNHIHAEDLARASLFALMRARAGRVYNVNDDSQLRVGEYLDLVAAHARLPPPPRRPMAELRATLDPMRLSFMEESRRLRNGRLKRELRLRLLYPDVRAGLRAAPRAG